MNESYKCILETLRKDGTKAYMLYKFIYINFEKQGK